MIKTIRLTGSLSLDLPPLSYPDLQSCNSYLKTSSLPAPLCLHLVPPVLLPNNSPELWKESKVVLLPQNRNIRLLAELIDVISVERVTETKLLSDKLEHLLSWSGLTTVSGMGKGIAISRKCSSAAEKQLKKLFKLHRTEQPDELFVALSNLMCVRCINDYLGKLWRKKLKSKIKQTVMRINTPHFFNTVFCVTGI